MSVRLSIENVGRPAGCLEAGNCNIAGHFDPAMGYLINSPYAGTGQWMIALEDLGNLTTMV
jgi:hypothetical protein